MTVTLQRRLPVGVELSDGAAHVRVWAPGKRTVDLVFDRDRARTIALDPEPDGHFSAIVEGLGTGDRYWFRLDGGPLRPDPASRFQPEGPHGPSMVVDPSAYVWTDEGWRGVEPIGQVLYEMHVGTFTREGTWQAAARELEALADLGITVIEMMPVNDFAGRFGWGYDGVNLYAPTRLYGTPDDLRAFVDRAHRVGIGVILDVVYNHVGPAGNYLEEFSPDYFTRKYENDWGPAVNFEGPLPAREFFVRNGAYWIDEFHFDGLRIDATQDIHDASPQHAVAEMVARARAAAPGRRIYIVSENEPQHTTLVRPASAGGHGGDALWNDDFHHTAVVALTGRREAYYSDYKGSAQELISAAKYGYLYQGQWYDWQKKRRGTPALDLPAHAFVAYLENHDQVANSAYGRRLHQLAAPGRLRAITALLLLGPATPMLFQGQEFAASSPFQYFADHEPDLQAGIVKGRREFLSQFPSITDPELLARLPTPGIQAFERSRLDLSERETHAEWYALHRDLLHLRHGDPVINGRARTAFDGAVLGPEIFALRFCGGDRGDRLLVVNLGCDMDLVPVPEPLLAPPAGARWEVAWSSEAPAYGGAGRAPLDLMRVPHLQGESAVLLRSTVAPDPEPEPHGELDDQ